MSNGKINKNSIENGHQFEWYIDIAPAIYHAKKGSNASILCVLVASFRYNSTDTGSSNSFFFWLVKSTKFHWAISFTFKLDPFSFALCVSLFYCFIRFQNRLLCFAEYYYYAIFSGIFFNALQWNWTLLVFVCVRRIFCLRLHLFDSIYLYYDENQRKGKSHAGHMK